MWQPSERLRQVFDHQIVARREYWLLFLRDERRPQIAEELHAAGLGHSGAHLTTAYQATEQTLFSCAREILEDLLQTLTDVYGAPPIEALEWVRSTLNAQLDLLVIELGRQMDELSRTLDSGDEPSRYTMALQQRSHIVRRELEIRLGKLEVRAGLRHLTPPRRATSHETDVFISHASEDKAEVAEPLAHELERRGYTVWLDRAALRLGDRLLDKIDEGLAGCRYGVTVLSAAFFAKNWPRSELAGLAARQDAEERKIILPVWHRTSHAEIARHSPILAAVLGVSTDEGIAAVVDAIEAVLKNE